MASGEAALPPALQIWAKLCGSAAEFEQVWREVEERQAQSIASKKRLADDTRSFEKLSEAERTSGTPALLKAYQTEINTVSKRAKYAEAALSELLSLLRGVPAATAVQEELRQYYSGQAASKAGGKAVRDIEETLRQREVQVTKLAEAAADLEAELQTMKNQDVTVRRLQKQIKDLEAGNSADSADIRRQKDEEWAKRVEDLRQEFVMERERQGQALEQLAQRCEARDEEVQRLRQERLEEQRRAEEAALARSLEVDALNSDLERAQAELERERLQRAEVKALPAQQAQGSVKVLQSLLDCAQQRALGLEREAGDLRRQLAEAEARAQRREADFGLERGELADAVAAKDAEVQGLREQLALRPSFDEVAELRQQLRNVEAVELSDEGAAATDLERRLLQRQKGLEGQLSEARVRMGELSAEAAELREKLRAAEDEGKDLRRLVERLEGQLVGGGPGAGGPPPTAAPTASEPPSLEALLPSVGSGLPSAAREAMPSMLEIVTGQRDRLRERLGDLEQERDRWRTSAEEERKRAEALHKDNVRLLERARYLQSMQPNGAGLGRARGKAPGAADRDLESRYGAAYEDTLGPSNPWEQFREDEKARRVASLGVGERGLVLVGSALLSSKVVRLFALGYLLAMHLLVFAVLMRLAQMHHNC
uniref:Protein CASP n=1 Tax=Alexandrium monilatum TaxID=311494 RepID=A0A7S4W208_9DINO|mmetsp:Transcript_17317/g.52169  ORF Transcript_17317/g.52169 Transcript_17317/m.52169 type:complete len:656 (+) Transcript_17317:82-2049(+)